MGLDTLSVRAPRNPFSVIKLILINIRWLWKYTRDSSLVIKARSCVINCYVPRKLLWLLLLNHSKSRENADRWFTIWLHFMYHLARLQDLWLAYLFNGNRSLPAYAYYAHKYLKYQNEIAKCKRTHRVLEGVQCNTLNSMPLQSYRPLKYHLARTQHLRVIFKLRTLKRGSRSPTHGPKILLITLPHL